MYTKSTWGERICRVMLLPVVLISAAVLSGCGDDTTMSANQNVENNTFSRTGTLQGSVFDATTGARIGDTSLSVTLVDGANYISPSSIKNNPTSDNPNYAGDYAFTNVNVSINNNKTYRVVATATGYQKFEGYVTWDTSSTTNNTIDTVYGMVGNIYLFPLGATAPSMTVNVVASSDPVEGAIVQLQPQINANNSTAGTSNVLGASGGTMVNLTGTTDASGNVTFAGSSLVLGGQYNVVVLPSTSNGVNYDLNNAYGTVVIGLNSPEVAQVSLTASQTNAANEGLYIVNTSNNDPSDITATGVLTLTFNRAIEIVSESSFTATLAGATTAVLDTTNGASSTVDATVSTDGLVLTLTPKFGGNGTAVVAFTPGATGTGTLGSNTADRGLSVTYAGGQIRLAGDDGAVVVSPLAVNTITGAVPNATVQMTSSLDD